METSDIKTPNRSSHHPHSHSHSPSFLFHNGFGEIDISDIEMITIQTVTYTSLKDLLPASPPTIMSPTHNSSWHEVPIKNPLVKHAALAYLQPMSTPPEVGDKSLLRIIREKCLCGCSNGLGCFAWLGDVVLKRIRDVFGGVCCRNGFEIGDEDYDDEDDDDDVDEEYVKVD